MLAFVRDKKDVNLNCAHCFLAETLTYLEPPTGVQMARTVKFSTENIRITCACVRMFVTQPLKEAVVFVFSY